MADCTSALCCSWPAPARGKHCWTTLVGKQELQRAESLGEFFRRSECAKEGEEEEGKEREGEEEGKERGERSCQYHFHVQ